MFHSVGRIMRWAGAYRKRMVLGFVCSFFATWCTAGPVMLAAWALGRLIGNAWGESEISASLPWLCLVGITALILLRFLFTYWKNRLQESIGTERAADQRMELGDMLKRVSLGYFARNNLGDILTALTTELSTLELQSMKMVDAVINGYIQVAVILLCVAIFCPPAALVALLGVLVSAFALRGIGAVVTNFETNQKTAVYDMEKAAGKDPYEMFLSGSVSLLTIENPSAKTDKELVIFRDSFASSLAPLLIDGYAKITLVDIRYLPSARLGSFVTFDKQDVLLLYSVPVLNNSETIK